MTCVVKRGEEMVFCMVDLSYEKYANFSTFFLKIPLSGLGKVNGTVEGGLDG